MKHKKLKKTFFSFLGRYKFALVFVIKRRMEDGHGESENMDPGTTTTTTNGKERMSERESGTTTTTTSFLSTAYAISFSDFLLVFLLFLLFLIVLRKVYRYAFKKKDKTKKKKKN